MGLVSGSGVPVNLARPLARGGQGEVFEVAGRRDVVFKRYLASELAKDQTLPDRLALMLANRPPKWREAHSHHILLAWPCDTVSDEGRFVGCLMPRIDAGRTARLLRVSDPSDRDTASGETEWLRGFTWRYLLTTAGNLALAVEVLHGSDVVIGDFNDANVAVTPEARVTLFDCDSMQVTDPASGRHFLCRVGRPDFTPPELIDADLRTTVRPRSSDLFALAVHIHQLLLEGEHPFRGRWRGLGDPPAETVLAREGLWTYGGLAKTQPRPAAIGIDLLPANIIALFRRAFVEGATAPGRRPTATEWKEALHRLATQLATCPTHPGHTYPNFCRTCPWCQHDARLATLMAPRTAAPRPSGRRPGTAPGRRPFGSPILRPTAPARTPMAPALHAVPSRLTTSPAATSGVAPLPAATSPPAPSRFTPAPTPPAPWPPTTAPVVPPTPVRSSSPWSSRSFPRSKQGKATSIARWAFFVLWLLFGLGTLIFQRINPGQSGTSGSSNVTFLPSYTLTVPNQVLDPQGAQLAAAHPYTPAYSSIYHPPSPSGTGFAPAPGDFGKTEMSHRDSYATAPIPADTILITLDDRVENVPPDAGAAAAASGQRYEAFIFTVRNTGSLTDGEAVNGDVYARPVGGTDTVRAGQAGNELPLPVQCAGQNAYEVDPGTSVQVCATFEVPTNEEFSAIYWSWDGGAFPTGGTWYLPSP